MEERAPYMTALAERDPEREHQIAMRAALNAEIKALRELMNAKQRMIAVIERRLGLDCLVKRG